MAHFPPVPAPSLEQAAERSEKQCDADFPSEIAALKNKIQDFEDLQVRFFSAKSSDKQVLSICLLSARLAELMLSSVDAIRKARYSSALVLLRVIIETSDLMQYLSANRLAAEKWWAGEEIKPETTRSIYAQGDLETRKKLYGDLCDVVHANAGGLGTHMLWIGENQPAIGHSNYDYAASKTLVNFLLSQTNEIAFRLGGFVENK